ncbi:hypothetical protein [Natranaerovirga hydrolytica]|uniref:hypothetical protein n=1 Tax=Natranaerovirga hydrolytica TaxID=680378 RepID=UPI0010451C4B|nr:hypothetical protein [Natranaerovirga hydrolytica]
MKEKILVCITIQENSLKLIEEGARLASDINGELHILYVEKGMSIFDQEGAINTLERLFELGKELGGEIHFYSDQNITGRIINVVEALNITQLLVGQTMENKISRLLKKDLNNKLINKLGNVKIIVKDRK